MKATAAGPILVLAALLASPALGMPAVDLGRLSREASRADVQQVATALTATFMEHYEVNDAKTLETNIRDAILALLENIRAGMVTGFPELGIPPLDPLVMGDIPFNVTWDDNTVYGTLFGTELMNLSQFIVTQVLVEVGVWTEITLGIETQQLQMNGTYTIDGHALGTDVFGDGKYRIDLDDLRFSLYMAIGFSNVLKFLEVKIITADFVLNSAEVHFDNLMGGGVMGGLVNEALSAALPVLLKQLEDSVVPGVLDNLMQTLNTILCDHQLRPGIFPRPQQTPHRYPAPRNPVMN